MNGESDPLAASCSGRLSPRPALRLWLALLLCLISLLAPPGGAARGAATGRFIDFLYVEANEGDSSGGHTALRFENQIFHFQYRKPGIIRIQRLESEAFTYLYAGLGNRTIRESRIAVSEETSTLLRKALMELLLTQESHLARGDELYRQVTFLERLAQGGGRSKPLPVTGAGYFFPDQKSGSEAEEGGELPSPELLALGERIRATQGEGFLEQRISQAERDLRQAPLLPSPPLPPRITQDRFPTFAPSAATRYDNALSALFALRTLRAAPPLRPGTFLTGRSDGFRLQAHEALILRRFARRQEDDLLRLITSSRPDWGFPFLVGMARLSVINASLASNRLMLLDIFPENGGAPPHARQGSVARHGEAILREKRELFRLRRAEFFGVETPGEAQYAMLERTANLLVEMEQAMAGNREPRTPPEGPAPSREAWRSDLPLPELDGATLARKLEAARAAEREYTDLLLRLYPYNLVRRNCVTELFATINRALEQSAATPPSATATPRAIARKESEKRLGGFIDPSQGLIFVPFISAEGVNSRYRVVSRTDRLSHRRRLLEEMKKRESTLLVFLRESNTLTSTIYRPAPGDSLFLFFTDDLFLPRPLFGAFNLLAGAGESLLGLVTLPFQGPARLIAGARGMLFSLPELFFVNIRKGTMEYVETVQRQTPEIPPDRHSPPASHLTDAFPDRKN
jgi:hypothetical protein